MAINGGNTAEVCDVDNQLGVLFYNRQEFEIAKDHFESAIKIFTELCEQGKF